MSTLREVPRERQSLPRPRRHRSLLDSRRFGCVMTAGTAAVGLFWLVVMIDFVFKLSRAGR